jgi:hypothetical protein
VGGLTWVLATARDRAMALAMDMTESLRSTRDELQSTLNAIPDLLFELDPQGRIERYRPGGADMLHVPADLFEGRLLQDVVGPQAAAGCSAALEAAQSTGHVSGYPFSLDVGGQTRWFELSLARKGEPTGAGAQHMVALSRDITERKLAEARTHQLAYFDGLTGLPNRRMLLDRLDHALASARKSHAGGGVVVHRSGRFQADQRRPRAIRLGDANSCKQVAQSPRGSCSAPATRVARIGGRRVCDA